MQGRHSVFRMAYPPRRSLIAIALNRERTIWSARPPGVLRPLRCAAHPTMGFSLRKKWVFNLSIDAMEPLLGPLCSFLISGDLCLQLPNSSFGGTQLIR